MEGKGEFDGGKQEMMLLLFRMVGVLVKGEISEVEVVDNLILLIFVVYDIIFFVIVMIFKMLV